MPVLKEELMKKLGGMMDNEKEKIAIIDDHPALRQGLKMFIETDGSFNVCGEAGNVNDAIKLSTKKNPASSLLTFP